MAHPSHKFKAYCGDAHKPLVFCSECGKEENETEINQPCVNAFYVEKLVDTKVERPHTKFVSGLP